MVKVAAIAALAFTVFSGVTQARSCQNITVPVTVSSRNGVFDITAPTNNIEVTNFILNLSRQGHNFTQELLTGYATVSGTYNVAATLCLPDKGATAIQLLTHGIGFDRSYWDLSYNNYQYSYSAVATDRYGYATFAWDRLGVGMSQRGEPINEIQAFLEAAALVQLTKMLRAGTLPGCGQKFHKVAHVGHSFGSGLSYSLANSNPDLSDAVVLTGFSGNSTFIPYFQLGGNFVSVSTVPALSSYPVGYFAAGDVSAVQTNFFAPGNFDPNVLQLAYQTGQPVTIGELLTLGSNPMMNKYPGPVQVVTGERDLPFCGGDCLRTGNPALSSIPAGVKMAFPSARALQTNIISRTGHGLNLEFSYPQTYQVINQFLQQQIGL